MSEATLHWLFTGRPGHRRRFQKATKTREVFFMLRQEYCDQPVRRNDSHEVAVSVDDSQSRFSMANRAPRGNLLVDARRDNRGSTIHKRFHFARLPRRTRDPR